MALPKILACARCEAHSCPARHRALSRCGVLCAALLACLVATVVNADPTHHALWELHGRRNTVYLMGSIHVLRTTDYPLAPAMLEAYGKARALVMEIDLDELDTAGVQAEMLSGATLPEDQSLPGVLGPRRYAHAAALAHDIGMDLSTFDRFEPWFAAEAISQLQLTQIGFNPKAGVEMYFLERARSDGKKVTGLETVHDQISLFEAMAANDQAEYLVSSLEQARELPQEIDDMVRAWQHGDIDWFERQLRSEFGGDAALYRTFLVERNRKWVPKIEALLNDDKNYLVIVGTGHLVGRDSVVEMLRKDGVGAAQR